MSAPESAHAADGLTRVASVLTGQRRLADDLVEGVPHERSELRDAVRSLDRLVRWHHAASTSARRPRRSDPVSEARFAREHIRFLESMRELRWFLDIVEREDHGGHRQALGQYWRLVLESLERHLADELQTATDRPLSAARRS